MALVKISVDIYALDADEVYRIYVNDTLMVERTFRWPPTENFIRENLVIDVPPGEYSVYVTPLSTFILKNVIVNGALSNDTFIIR